METGAPIVVVGEALVDLILGPDLAVDAHLGGGPFNAARTIARLGQPTAFLGPLSRDAFGDSLRAALEADGVAVDPALLTDLPTTLAMVVLDDAGAAEYQFHSAGTSAPALDARMREVAFPLHAHSVHVGGLGLVFEPSATTILELLNASRGAELVSLDPNFRPHAIPDLDEHRHVVRTAAEYADIVKISDQDAEILEPGQDPEATARGLLARGPTLVVLTRGAEGALVLTRAGEISVPAPRVEVTDTVGAGDAFSGALLADIRRRRLGREDLADLPTIREVVAFAVRVAGIVCTRSGADPPYLSEVTPSR